MKTYYLESLSKIFLSNGVVFSKNIFNGEDLDFNKLKEEVILHKTNGKIITLYSELSVDLLMEEIFHFYENLILLGEVSLDMQSGVDLALQEFLPLEFVSEIPEETIEKIYEEKGLENKSTLLELFSTYQLLNKYQDIQEEILVDFFYVLLSIYVD